MSIQQSHAYRQSDAQSGDEGDAERIEHPRLLHRRQRPQEDHSRRVGDKPNYIDCTMSAPTPRPYPTCSPREPRSRSRASCNGISRRGVRSAAKST